jgi:hypothetical protein
LWGAKIKLEEKMKMKKKIALFLGMALIAGLIVSCGDPDPDKPGTGGNPDDPNNPNGPNNPAVTRYTVTFDADGGTFDDGTTANKTVEVEEGKAVTVAKWPDAERGTDDLIGWFDGDTEYTFSKTITKNVTLKAKWEGATFTTVDANTVTHDNFVIKPSPLDAHNNFTGDDNGDNSFSIKVGAVRYQFPITVGFDYHDYDFVEVEYTAAVVNDTVFKQFADQNNWPPFKDTNNNNLQAGTDKTITFEIRQSTGGFAIQKWKDSSADTEIEFTKITFKKGTRYTVSFDTDGGTTLADTYLVDGTQVGKYLPYADGKAGFFFAGWSYPDGTAVSSNDEVDSDFQDIELKAIWLSEIANLEPIEVSFEDGDEGDFVVNAVNVILTKEDEDGIFHGYSYSGSINYDWSGAAFNIEIPAGATLAHYDYVKFKLSGVGDVGGKTWFLLAGAAVNFNPVKDGDKVSDGVYIQSADGGEVKIPIIKPAAAGLTGTVLVSLFAMMGNGTTPATAPEFYDIVFGIDE